MAPDAPLLDDRTRAALEQLAGFPLLDAVYGRRARRFALGGEIPDGPLAYRSRHPPLPLTELERLLVLCSMAGTTGWHYGISRNPRLSPRMPSYAAGAAGRTYPSAAGIQTSELFLTDDEGIYLFATRDAGAQVDPAEEEVTPERMLERHARRLRRISDRRLDLPREEPYYEAHNLWCANVPGSLLVIPVADLAQHALAGLFFAGLNGLVVADDVNGRPVPGLEEFRGLFDLENPMPLTFFDQYMLTEATAELACACYAGVLTLQAMGLGGWMFDGLDRFALLGAAPDPNVRGLGFRYDVDPRWSVPNPTGLPGVFEAFCPPHQPSMEAAVDAVIARKFGPGGPYHPDTPGAWTDSPAIRGAGQRYSAELREVVVREAEYLYRTFGKFPATVPSVFCLTFVQAQHLDVEFYDRFFRPGAYLPSHGEHLQRWHGG